MIDWGLVIKIGVTLAVVTLPAAGGIAYLVVKRWGEKYVDSKFDRAMEKLKYAHQFEIELLKGSVQGEVSRAARFFEQEFTALSESHKLLIRSVSSAQDLLNRLQQAPGVVGLTDAQIQAMLSKAEIGQEDIDKVLAETKPFDRQKIVSNLWIHRKFNTAWSDWVAFRNYRLDHSIFLDEEILEPIGKIDALIHDALDEWKMEEEMPDPRPNRYPLRDKMFQEVPPLRETMEKMLRARVTLALRPTPQRELSEPAALRN
ncbi:hypothetical protein [Asticcacaulis sp.]|uniref:hypothetical protein n=1 Tax=Asticcacaulis sp. TaxID=1872648 RepID=UPI0026383465|nr:hypothetical protein [Asticcacaulis sp.]